MIQSLVNMGANRNHHKHLAGWQRCGCRLPRIIKRKQRFTIPFITFPVRFSGVRAYIFSSVLFGKTDGGKQPV